MKILARKFYPRSENFKATVFTRYGKFIWNGKKQGWCKSRQQHTDNRAEVGDEPIKGRIFVDIAMSECRRVF